MLVHRNFGGIKLDLHPVEQGILGVKPGGHLIEGPHGLDETGQMPVGENEGQIARHGGFQGGHCGGAGQTIRVCAAALEQIPQTLDHDASAGEHVPSWAM